jgi:hypothetical protein
MFLPLGLSATAASPPMALLHERFLFPADFSRRFGARRISGRGPTKNNVVRTNPPDGIKFSKIKSLCAISATSQTLARPLHYFTSATTGGNRGALS